MTLLARHSSGHVAQRDPGPTVTFPTTPAARRWWWSTGVVIAVVDLWVLWPGWPSAPAGVLTAGLVTTSFLLTGLLLLGDRRLYPNAWIPVATAAAWTATSAGSRPVGPLPLIEFVADPLAYVLIALFLLRYPDHRLGGRRERVLIATTATWVVVGRLVWTVLTTPQDHGYVGTSMWWPTLVADPVPNEVIGAVYRLGCAVLVALVLVHQVVRLRRAISLDRHVLAPVFVATAAAAVALLTEITARLFPHHAPVFSVVLAVALVSLPGSFLVAAVRRRLTRSVVADLVPELIRPAGPVDLRAVLRRALREPGLDLAFWLPEEDRWVHPDGTPAPPEPAGRRFRLELRADDGEPLGRLEGDRALERHADLADAMLAASALAWRHARLQARVVAQLHEVQASRLRLLEAGQAERRRIERDLHDGLQQRLLSLRMHLAVAISAATTDAERDRLGRLRDDLAEAIREVRDLARGVFPAVLADGGLAPALEALAARTPLPISLRVPDDRWSPTAETTAYHLACEAVSNAVKYASARHVDIEVAVVVRRRPVLRIAVQDDGIGGAVPIPSGGLAGLHDRVAAAGGTLVLDSLSGVGTTITAELPCG